MGTCDVPMVSIWRLRAHVVVMCSAVCFDVEQMFAVCKMLQEDRHCRGREFRRKKDTWDMTVTLSNLKSLGEPVTPQFTHWERVCRRCELISFLSVPCSESLSQWPFGEEPPFRHWLWEWVCITLIWNAVCAEVYCEPHVTLTLFASFTVKRFCLLGHIKLKRNWSWGGFLWFSLWVLNLVFGHSSFAVCWHL